MPVARLSSPSPASFGARPALRSAAAAAALACAALLAGPAHAAEVVVPGNLASVEGDIDNCIPFTGCLDFTRYQQVFASSQFASLGGPVWLSGLSWRLDGEQVNNLDVSLASVTIGLSTTTRAPDALSAVFADNLGADATVVRSGALTLAAVHSGVPGLQAFDITIDFDTPFLYDASAGHLLLDWTSSGGVTTRGFAFADATNVFGDSVSRVAGDGPSGAADSLGLVTRFTTASAVPLPGTLTLTLLGLGLLGVAGRRR